MRAVVAGAGVLGRKISRYLINFGYEVIFIDNDQNTIREVTEEEGLAGIHGQSTSLEVLQKVDIGKADLFVAATSNDDMNLLACALAATFGTPKRVARLSNQHYLSSEWLNFAFNKKAIAATSVIETNVILAKTIADILSYRQESVDKVYSFFSGKVKLLSIIAIKELNIIGHTVKELYSKLFRFNLRVITVYRRGHFSTNLEEEMENFVVEENDCLYILIESKQVSEFLISINTQIENTVSGKYYDYNYVTLLGDHYAIPYLVSTLIQDPKVRLKVITTNVEQAKGVMNDLKLSDTDKVNVILSKNLEQSIREIYARYDEDFIILNNSDKQTIYMALFCKHCNIGNISCVVNDSEYARLVRDLGVKHIYNVDNYLIQPIIDATKGPYENAVYLIENSYQMVEQIVVKGSKLVGRKISEINEKYAKYGMTMVSLLIHPDNIDYDDENYVLSGGEEYDIYLRDKRGMVVQENDVALFMVDYNYIKNADEILTSFD